MERLLFIALFLIMVLLIMICYVLIGLHNDLKSINRDIRKAHPKMFYFDNSINDVTWNETSKF